MTSDDLFPPGEKCPMIMKALCYEVAKTLGNSGYRFKIHITPYWVSIAQEEWTRIMEEADRKQVFNKIGRGNNSLNTHNAGWRPHNGVYTSNRIK